MSRVANLPIALPSGVEVKVNQATVTVKGSKGQLSYAVHPKVKVAVKDGSVYVKWDNTAKKANAQAGTVRSSINNMIIGVSNGFEKKLTLVGIGYRAQSKGKLLVLSLGFSNPVEYQTPDGITVNVLSQTELSVTGNNKQQVGQVASEIRAFRPPEPYKGKGIRYTDEHVVKKEAKKK